MRPPESGPAPRGQARAKDMAYAISAADAWKACGSSPEFEPSRPANPASGRMLWRLNVAGLLVLAEPVSHPDAEQDKG